VKDPGSGHSRRLKAGSLRPSIDYSTCLVAVVSAASRLNRGSETIRIPIAMEVCGQGHSFEC
jgi:hypothetical protein